jgi:S-DNA-T family DNA segregation ATPase FtsK/SpoIIIE
MVEAAIVLDAPTVSRHHASFEHIAGAVTVHDLGSRNGTLVDGTLVEGGRGLGPDQVIRLGAVAVAVRPGVPAPDPTGTDDRGARPFNRPPRSVSTEAVPGIRAPERPAVAGTGRAHVSIAMVVAPIAFAAVSMVLFSPVMAVFALMGPVMMLGSWAEHRVRDRRRRRRWERDRIGALATFEAEAGILHRHDLAVLRRRRPDPAHLLEQAAGGRPGLWERRLDHVDAMQVVVGLGDLAWRPDLHDDISNDDQLLARLQAIGPLRDAPVSVELGAGHVVGLAGPASACAAVARSMAIQVALLHGPADVEITVVDDARPGSRWQCLQALPHHRATPQDPSVALAAPAAPAGPIELAIVDVAAARLADGILTRLLAASGGRMAAIVLAGHPDELPSHCTTVVELLDADGGALVRWPATGESIRPLLATGVDEATLRAGGTLLARFSDPDRVDPSAGLPDRIELDDLLDATAAATMAERWARSACHPDRLPVAIGARAPRPARPSLGADPRPPSFTVDLATDGPHMLIGGTTGSGKSELLRTLVLALALDHSPLDLTFLLIDYKGGSAFDACTDLPHTVGLVTDLDEHLGARALTSLDAEIRRREHLLRIAGAADLVTYRRSTGAGDPTRPPLPRLMVLIDEFATLAAELPDFLDAIVGVAQRGRSLGVHLVLATQRPHGAVNDRIRTNTNLRIALRMLDRADSADVIDDPAAASIPRGQPGRAIARLGHDELVEFQTAMISADRVGELVREISETAAGLPPAPAPWTPPLPCSITLDALPTPEPDDQPGAVPIALADEPEHQRRAPWSWYPTRGNLIVYGMPGSGTTTVLVTIGLSVTADHSPDDVHLYGIADTRGRLSLLGGLPHAGSVIAADDLARQARLIRRLADELDRRRQQAATSSTPPPMIVTLIDDLPALLAQFDTLAGQHVVTELTRVFRDGPAHGIHLVVTGDRPGSIPVALSARTSERLVLHLPDPYDRTSLGLQFRGATGHPPPPGRGWVGQGRGTEVQVATCPDIEAEVRRAARRYPTTPAPGWATPVGELAAAIPIDALGSAQIGDGCLVLPIGVADRTLDPCALVLHDGDHALVVGPPRSGRSTTLCTLALGALDAGRRHGTPIAVIALAGRASPLTGVTGITVALSIGSLVRAAAGCGRVGAVLVLVDDADTIDDPDGALTALIAASSPQVHVVAAGRADRFRTAYSHWAFGLRSSRCGLTLQPDPELDGDLWGVRLPRHPTTERHPGRGYLVLEGEIEHVQVAADRPAGPMP